MHLLLCHRIFYSKNGGTNTPKTSPSPCTTWTPSEYSNASANPTHQPKPQLHFRTVTALSPHWLQWGAPYLPPKIPLPVDRSQNPSSCLIPGPVRPTKPNCIWIQSAISPQCTGQTHRPTDSWRETLTTISRLRLYKEWCGLTNEIKHKKTIR